MGCYFSFNDHCTCSVYDNCDWFFTENSEVTVEVTSYQFQKGQIQRGGAFLGTPKLHEVGKKRFTYARECITF